MCEFGYADDNCPRHECRVFAGTAAITHVNPQIKYLGSYPAAPLTEGTHGGFTVKVKVHMWAATATQGTLSVAGSWGAEGTETTTSSAVSVPAGDSIAEVSVSAPASAIQLWWPAGQGAQPLYNVTVSFGKLNAVR